MAKEQQERLEALPTFLQPKLRLFLSVDLVGSTAAKQRPSFPISEPRNVFMDGGMAPPWLSPIANFFGEFQEAFAREWRNFRSQTAPRLGIEVRFDPFFWKANGDELIFVKELSHRREVLGCVDAWLQALKSIRPHLIKVGLDAKATAWTAGFPVTNSELVFLTHPTGNDIPYEDDPRLQQFALLEESQSPDGPSQGIVVDYIGPSIDTGFRLAGLSTPRQFIISIDVAYFLATARQPSEKVINTPPIFFGGNVILKGVLGGKPYPMLWIDTMAEDQFAQAEDRLAGKKSVVREEIEVFCNHFYKQNHTVMFEPFIFREPESELGRFPENYVEALEHLHSKWRSEMDRYESENKPLMSSGTRLPSISDGSEESKKNEVLSLVKSKTNS